VGLNGVGTKAVNALSKSFVVQSFRDGLSRKAGFSQGLLQEETKDLPTHEKNGSLVDFVPDGEIFRNFYFIHEFMRVIAIF
jgi:topoisomerase-4 subunit B